MHRHANDLKKRFIDGWMDEWLVGQTKRLYSNHLHKEVVGHRGFEIKDYGSSRLHVNSNPIRGVLLE